MWRLPKVILDGKPMEPLNIAYNMDCMEYMRDLPDNAFDLAVVDPPYGDGNSQSVHAEREREREREREAGRLQPIRRLVEPIQRSTTDSARGSTSTRISRGGITGRTNTTWANPDRGNMGGKVRQKNYSVGHGPG